MQTITVKYLSATNHKPSRLKATNSGKSDSLTVSIHSMEFDRIEEAYCQIARKLARKLNWKGTMQGGTLSDGNMVFVFLQTKDRFKI